MKKLNLVIVAAIVATFAISMFAFQPTETEASNNAFLSVTPTPSKKPPTTPIIINGTKTKNLQPCAVGRENSIECLKAKNPSKARRNNRH